MQIIWIQCTCNDPLRISSCIVLFGLYGFSIVQWAKPAIVLVKHILLHDWDPDNIIILVSPRDLVLKLQYHKWPLFNRVDICRNQDLTKSHCLWAGLGNYLILSKKNILLLTLSLLAHISGYKLPTMQVYKERKLHCHVFSNLFQVLIYYFMNIIELTSIRYCF